MLITIQRRTPWTRGLMPTERITSVESDAPMKNIVIVRHLRAIPETVFPNSGMLSRTKVFRTIAMTKKMINQGMLTFLSLFLKIIDVTSARGMIHNALVSLMVVATFRASSPYAAPAPTTELVS